MADGGTAPPRSLRRRWSRALALVLAVFVAGVAANMAGARSTAAAFRHVAEQMERDAGALSDLRAAVVQTALLRSAAVQQPGDDQAELRRSITRMNAAFEHAIAVLRPGGGREIVAEQYARTKALWPEPDMTGILPMEFIMRSSQGQANFALLDQAAEVSRARARSGLSRAAGRERAMTIGSALVALLLVGLVARFARRLSMEVLRPVARLRDSAGKLAAGELDHRVEVERADEIGDLATTFNAMADVIASSHRDLSIRASQDALTGLANRATFNARLQAALAGPERRESALAVLFVDLDDYKDVNDALGHAAGDEVLRTVAGRLTASVRPGDLVARLGGDEFALVLDGVDDAVAALAVAERAVAALADPIEIAGTSVRIGASAGLAMRRPGSDAAGLIREADAAMYQAKGEGKNCVRFHAPAPDRPPSDLPQAGQVGR
ncbi:MAG TPA: GGDEF domain-containing protein [Acidimicrobiales bacterium]|nr:GGDEF domain-containing protein [Acidimicrobiales bacterium]